MTLGKNKNGAGKQFAVGKMYRNCGRAVTQYFEMGSFGRGAGAGEHLSRHIVVWWIEWEVVDTRYVRTFIELQTEAADGQGAAC